MKGIFDIFDVDDVDSFVQQLTACQDDLLLFIRTICGDFHLAADIRQEVNMVLWRKRRKFTPGTSFRNWAYKVAQFEVQAFSRRTNRRSTVPIEPELLDCFVTELPTLLDELPERRRALSLCIEALTPKDHELIHHRYWSESTLEALATSSGRSVGTLKARLFQLRTALRLCIRERLMEVSV